MLEATGAGATAHSDIDWHEVWKSSPEATTLQKELETIHTEGRSRPVIAATQKSEFATSWFYQVAVLVQRDSEAHWRDPTYLLAKLALNIVAGLLIGFTFWKSKDSLQGIQNKLFVCLSYSISRNHAHDSNRQSIWVPSSVFRSPVNFKSCLST